MNARLQALFDDILRIAELSPADQTRALRRASWLTEGSSEELREFLRKVSELPAPLSAVSDALLRAAFEAIVAQRRLQRPATTTDSATIAELLQTYRHLGSESTARPWLLAWLALGSGVDEVEAVVEMLIDDPPSSDVVLLPVIRPLFRKSLPVERVFPRLLAGLERPLLAGPVLDLANYLTREKVVGQHPATERVEQLAALLGELSQSLAQLEEDPTIFGDDAAGLAQRVTSSVSLAVSLCDALALIGDVRAAGKLHQTMGLRHRRLKTEAAAALARLGDPDGAAELKRMAAEPVARLHALSYAKELGLLDQVEPQFITQEARAEAALIAWLAEPSQFGLPPTKCELVDRCAQFWPGYNEKVECFLFRFTYAFAVDDGAYRSFSNVGIAGPLVHAFTADVADLPPHDIYAAYAGWQAEHDDIRQYDVSRLSRSEQTEVARLERRLHDAGYQEIEPQQMGYFFGEKALLALAERDGVRGSAVADFDEIAFFPQRDRKRAIGVQEAYCIWKGRKLLRAFNASPNKFA